MNALSSLDPGTLTILRALATILVMVAAATLFHLLTKDSDK